MSVLLDLRKVDRETALRTWLAFHNITSTQLARELGVDPSFISRFLQGKRRSRRMLDKLKSLGVPPEILPEAGPGPGRPPSRPRATDKPSDDR